MIPTQVGLIPNPLFSAKQVGRSEFHHLTPTIRETSLVEARRFCKQLQKLERGKCLKRMLWELEAVVFNYGCLKGGKDLCA